MKWWEKASWSSLLKYYRKSGSYRGSVLITGDNGTGKSWCCWLHEKSNRSSGPFIKWCAAIQELIESELFGHVKDFTGANKDRAGKFEATNGGYHLSR
jgi:DNA-binding NtrC family response regulator